MTLSTSSPQSNPFQDPPKGSQVDPPKDPTNKELTLLIAVISTLATVSLSLTQKDSPVHISPDVALLISAIGAGAYALVRTLQKHVAGTPWKTLLTTTEAWGTGLVYLATIFSAVAGLVSPSQAVVIGTIATAMTGIARVCQKGVSFGPPTAAALVLLGLLSFGAPTRTFAAESSVVAAKPAMMASPTEPATPATAPNSRYGGCTTNQKLCFAPALAIALVKYDLSKGLVSNGVTPMIGYGFVYHAVVDLGFAVYGGTTVGNTIPTTLSGFGIISVANYLNVGAGIEKISGGERSYVLVIGTGTPVY